MNTHTHTHMQHPSSFPLLCLSSIPCLSFWWDQLSATFSSSSSSLATSLSLALSFYLYLSHSLALSLRGPGCMDSIVMGRGHLSACTFTQPPEGHNMCRFKWRTQLSQDTQSWPRQPLQLPLLFILPPITPCLPPPVLSSIPRPWPLSSIPKIQTPPTCHTLLHQHHQEILSAFESVN